MKQNLLQSLRDAILTKPNDRHTHTEIAALIRRQVPEAKAEVDAIMNERYNPPSAPSGMKQWVHPLLRNHAPEKKNTSGVEAEAVEVASRVVGTTKGNTIEKPKFVRPISDIDPEIIKDMDFEAFLDFFKTLKAIKEFAQSVGIEKPSSDSMVLFDQIKIAIK